MSLRLVRSPLAPKMTMTHSGTRRSKRRGSWKGFSAGIESNIAWAGVGGRLGSGVQRGGTENAERNAERGKIFSPPRRRDAEKDDRGLGTCGAGFGFESLRRKQRTHKGGRVPACTDGCGGRVGGCGLTAE